MPSGNVRRVGLKWRDKVMMSNFTATIVDLTGTKMFNDSVGGLIFWFTTPYWGTTGYADDHKVRKTPKQIAV